MNFASLCDFLDNVRNTKVLAEKTKLSKDFWRTVREQHHETFPILRLVVPKLDRDRASYRIKESKISKLLIKMLSLPPGSDQNLLLKSVMGSSIDFGDVVYSVLKKYIVNKEIGMTVDNINTYLDKIANRKTDNGLDDLILEIFRKLSPRNIKWLIQIILKDLKLGMGDNSVLNCFHQDGANFYATNNNLAKLCEVLHNPQVKLHELEIGIFEVFRPMLSKRVDASNFKKCFPESKMVIIENKFDGERFQLHMNEGVFKYFSRNGFPFTDSYGASFDQGIFTPSLKNVFSPETKKVILDGEMMLWNKNTKRFGSKGMNLDVKKLHRTNYQPCFCVFDILLHNDKVLTNQPLIKRLQLLKTVIKKTIVGTVILSDYKEGHSRDDIVDALNASSDNNEEGIVVKDPKSVYKCGDRNSGWFKIKMEYFDGAVNDLDVLLMGGSLGGNNRINSFVVGVSSGNNTYFSLGSISSGLNDEELDLINEKFRFFGIDFAQFSTKTEGKLFFGRETPDIYIEPQNSCIFQIRATELIRTTSDGVKCPYTLRFPRILSIREDKPVNECLSMNELLELTGQNKAVIKLNKRHIDLSEIISKSKSAKKSKVEVVNLFESQNGDFLEGKQFYVHSGTQTWAIENIYHCIKTAGGQVSYRLEPKIDIVLASKINPKLTELMQQRNNFDIIHVDWLKRVLDQKKLVEYRQKEIYSCGTNFKRNFGMSFDRFGDSFMEEATRESVEYSLEIMKQNDEFSNVNGAVTFGNKRSFAQFIAYFDAFKEINNPQSKQIYYSLPDEADFEYYHGTISKEISSKVNLVILGDNNKERKLLVRRFLESMGNETVEIVGNDFIHQNNIFSKIF